MRGTRGLRPICRGAGAALVALLLFHCGGESDGGSESPRAGGSGAGTAGAGSPGGAPSAGTTGDAGSGGSSGGSQGGTAGRGGSGGGSSGSGGGSSGDDAGGAPGAGQSASGGAAGLAGEGGAPDGTTADGFPCERERCVPGEVCVNCDFFGGAFPLICTPDPDVDPAGHQASVEQAGCLAVYPMFECDGPEDCALSERCVADPGQTYPAGACVAEVPCEEPYPCVICRTEDDCPAPSSCGSEEQSVLGARRYCG